VIKYDTHTKIKHVAYTVFKFVMKNDTLAIKNSVFCYYVSLVTSVDEMLQISLIDKEESGEAFSFRHC
jgi:hypothetical protein